MDNLDGLYSHLLEAQDAIYKNRLASTKMFLMAATGLIKPYKDDYSDVVNMYLALESMKFYLEPRVSLYRYKREFLADWVEELIQECEAWQKCRRAA